MTMQEPHRLRFHNWLLQNDLDEDVADAILATMAPYTWHDVATKADLARLEVRIDGNGRSIQDLHTEIGRLRTDMLGMRTDLGGEIGQLRTDMLGMRTDLGGEIGQLRTDLGGEIGQLRTEFASDRTAIASEFGQIRAEMAQMRERSSGDLAQFGSDITKQLVGLRYEIRIVLLALVGFMLSVVLAVTQGGIG